MHVDIEIVRPDDSEESSSEMYLKVEPAGHHPAPFFNRVYVDPNEIVTLAIDGKRTLTPKSCLRARLMRRAEEGQSLVHVGSEGVKSLRAKPGQPVVLLDSLSSEEPFFAIVKSSRQDHVDLDRVIPRTFFKGSFIQNIANRWHHEIRCVGAKSQLKRPQPVPFYLHPADEGIEMTISYPLTPGVLRAYDIYVRDCAFTDLEAHWWPDIVDLDINAESALITTYNGGEESGGGKLQNGQTYYVSLVAKDRLGFDDINESAPFVQAFTLS